MNSVHDVFLMYVFCVGGDGSKRLLSFIASLTKGRFTLNNCGGKTFTWCLVPVNANATLDLLRTDFYRPPRTLWEGNVLSFICLCSVLSVCSQDDGTL